MITKIDKNLWDFDYVYKGIYLTRLISYLFFLYITIIIYVHYTGENILTAVIITTGFIIFIMMCGYIGNIKKNGKAVMRKRL